MTHQWTITIKCKECGKQCVYLYEADARFNDCVLDAIHFMHKATKGRGCHRVSHGQTWNGWIRSFFRKR